MRNLLALIGAAVVLVAGAGWYLGWYSIGTEPGGNGHQKITVDVNTDQIKNNLKKGSEVVGDLLHHNSKGVDGQPTSWSIVPAGPVTPTTLPPPPPVRPLEFNPDGSPKVIVPPPPAFPNN
jgi:hypothetical protein